MGFIREPLGVDFTVNPQPLTMEEKKAISNYIRDYKIQKAKKVSKNNNIRQEKRLPVKS